MGIELDAQVCEPQNGTGGTRSVGLPKQARSDAVGPIDDMLDLERLNSQSGISH